MEPIKPTFSEVVYSEMDTWLGRTPCKGSDTTVNFDIRKGLAVAFIKSMGRWTTVCCELDWPDHRHESLGCDGKSTHPERFNGGGLSLAGMSQDGHTAYTWRADADEQMVCEDL